MNWQICIEVIDLEPMFVDSDKNPVQIEKSFYSELRKYNWDHIMFGAKMKTCELVDEEKIEDWSMKHQGRAVFYEYEED